MSRSHATKLRVPLSRAVAGLAVSLLAVVVPATLSTAATVPGAITTVSVRQDSVAPGGSMTLDLAWQVPDGTAAGDTFSLTLPPQLAVLGGTDFALKDADGAVVATATVSGSVVTFTATAYAQSHVQVHGSAFFSVELSRSVPTGPLDLVFDADGTLYRDQVQVAVLPATDYSTTATKWEKWLPQGTPGDDKMLWAITGPRVTGPALLTFTDTPGAGQALDCGSLSLWSGTANLSGSLQSPTFVPTSRWTTVQCSDTNAVVRFQPGSGDVDHVFMLMGRARVTDPSLAEYTNAGSVAVGDGVIPVTTVVAAAGGMGTGTVAPPSGSPSGSSSSGTATSPSGTATSPSGTATSPSGSGSAPSGSGTTSGSATSGSSSTSPGEAQSVPPAGTPGTSTTGTGGSATITDTSAPGTGGTTTSAPAPTGGAGSPTAAPGGSTSAPGGATAPVVPTVTVTGPTSTVTVTVGGPTVTATGPTTTITLPGQTVTVVRPGPTTTVTTTAPGGVVVAPGSPLPTTSVPTGTASSPAVPTGTGTAPVGSGTAVSDLPTGPGDSVSPPDNASPPGSATDATPPDSGSSAPTDTGGGSTGATTPPVASATTTTSSGTSSPGGSATSGTPLPIGGIVPPRLGTQPVAAAPGTPTRAGTTGNGTTSRVTGVNTGVAPDDGPNALLVGGGVVLLTGAGAGLVVLSRRRGEG